MFLQFFVPGTNQPAVGYQLFTYVAGTSIKQATWTDSTQTVQNANPVIADANGVMQVWLDPTLTYKFVLAAKNDTDPPTSPLYSTDNIVGYVNTGAAIGFLLYPQTAAEISAGVTPTNYSYPPGHWLRYIATAQAAGVIAGTSSYNASSDLQNWLNALIPGMTATMVGTALANGLVLKTSNVHFTGGGWIAPYANPGSLQPLLQLGQDSSSTAIIGITGEINVGRYGGTYLDGSGWGNVAGLGVQNATSCNLIVSYEGIGTGLLFNPTLSSASNHVISLNRALNCQYGVVATPSGSGFANENTFVGGRFTTNSGLYASSGQTCTHIQTTVSGVNNWRFIDPDFEGQAQVLNWNGSCLRIINARWENGISSGTAGTDFPTVFWNFGSNGTRNKVELSYNSQWLANQPYNSVYSTGSLTATSVTQFTFQPASSTSQTAFFFTGQLISLTISGSAKIATVLSSSYNSGTNTMTVNILQPILTANPTLIIAPRMNDAGLDNNILPALSDVGGSTWISETAYNRFLSLVRSAIAVEGASGTPALTLTDASSSSNDVLTVVDFPGTGTRSAGITAGGAVSAKTFGMAGASPAGQVTGWGTPTGVTQVSNFPGATATLVQCSEVIAKIIADLKTFGFYGS